MAGPEGRAIPLLYTHNNSALLLTHANHKLYGSRHKLFQLFRFHGITGHMTITDSAAAVH